QLLIVPGNTANENPAPASGEHPRIVSRVFDAVPACLQEQTVLRVHALGFGRRDIEKQRIESVVFFERTHPRAVGLARDRLTGLIPGIHIPALRRYRADAIPALRNVLPKL